MIERVVITDALLSEEKKIRLHPALLAWQKDLLAKRQNWQVEDEPWTPLSWFAAEVSRSVVEKGQGELSATSLLAAELPAELWTQADVVDAQQYWVVSPYHARLNRAELRVMPEHMLDWSAAEAEQMCVLLNPWLRDSGMKLHRLGCVLLLWTDRVWDVQSPSFAHISGHNLPNTPLAGADAGVWTRLMTEIQMMLHQYPISTAQGVPIHGLWAWQAITRQNYDVIAAVDWGNIEAVATRDAYLQVLLQAHDKAREATCIISTAEDLPMLLSETMPLPASWLLLGEGQSVELSPSWWRRGRALCYQTTWKGVCTK
ncbi:MAG: hypothetical protein Q9M19_01825 [Mariprofundaceae bacterium]|nr:hypothetical protein [Mariprofundaceae bacterium]